MPIRQCQINNEPGFKWGQSGKCYAYTPGDEESIKESKKKAIAQGVASGDLEALGAQIDVVRGSYKFSKDIELESYNDYPKSAVENAKRALKWADENGWGSCGTPVGKQRANQLANGENISRETISRMAGFERHRQNKDVPYSEGCGGLMWDAWGGDEGIAWAQKKLQEIDNQNLSFAVEKIGMDFDGTLATNRGQQLWRQLGGDYVITARSLFRLNEVWVVTDKLNIPRENVIAAGSNARKIQKVKDLGITTFYDDNSDVIKLLPGIGKLFNP